MNPDKTTQKPQKLDPAVEKDIHFEPSTESTKNAPTPEQAKELKQRQAVEKL